MVSRFKRAFKNFHGDERGEYMVQFVILFPLLIVMSGLVLDGGMMYQQYRRAEVAAQASAQAASHQIDVNVFRATDQVVLDPSAARDVALQFMQRNAGTDLKSLSIAVAPNVIEVDAQAQIPTIFFRLFGIDDVTVNVRSRAYPAFGINQEGQ